MVEDGDVIPEPSTLDALAADPAREGSVAFLVHVEVETERTVRINITVREKQVEEIDKLANEAGLTRSAFMVSGSSIVVSRGREAQSARERCEQEQRAVPPLVNERMRSMSLAGCWR
jgi:hypothetical protein